MHGMLSGVATLLAMLAFVATVIWAYSHHRHTAFDALARLPLEEDARTTQEDER